MKDHEIFFFCSHSTHRRFSDIRLTYLSLLRREYNNLSISNRTLSCGMGTCGDNYIEIYSRPLKINLKKKMGTVSLSGLHFLVTRNSRRRRGLRWRWSRTVVRYFVLLYFLLCSRWIYMNIPRLVNRSLL